MTVPLKVISKQSAVGVPHFHPTSGHFKTGWHKDMTEIKKMIFKK